jgi:carboxyl-terminal processing protease
MKKTIAFLVLLFVCVFGGLLNAAESNPYELFQEVLFYIENYHVDEQDRNELIKGAIRGMVETLDPFSEYMTEDDYDEMQLEMEGHFGGIGIVITPDLVIVSPIKGTPGEKVGLKAEDKIIAIDGQPTEDMTQKEAVDLMRGEPGTPVDLTIKREGVEENLEFHIIRSDIEIPYVESEMLEAQIGYVMIAQFAQDVGLKVEKAIEELEAQGARALILDLRSNPGGLLTEAVNVASNFFHEGQVVSVKKRYGWDDVLEVEKQFRATDLPLVVLIDQGSASASEIVAGAIKDRDRGTLIGMKSFGKGTVQSVVPLSDGSALRLTIGKYYTPSGEFIHDKGIEPDIEVEYDPEYEGDNQLDAAINYIKENFLITDLLKEVS